MSDEFDQLDELDAAERAIRRRQLTSWSRLRATDVRRAKAILRDKDATDEEKRDAKILIGADAIDPVLMMASGSNLSHYGALPVAKGATNRHPHVPSPPRKRRGIWAHLVRLLRR